MTQEEFKKLNPEELNTIIQGVVDGKNHFRRILYDSFAPKLLAVCRRYMGSLDDAEDVFQEAMVLIFLNIHQYDLEKGDLGAWMYRITVNEAIKQLKKNNSKLNDPLDISEIDSINFTKFDHNCTLNELKDYINSLPINQRTIFNLAVIEGYKHNEIAELLGIGESTSRSQLTRAKKTLREIIKDQEGEIIFMS